jgi:cyanophycin synthetase
MNRNLDAAVIENDSGVILGQGLSYDRCQVGVVTNIDDADHLGDFDINETDRMFNVFRTQVDVVLPTGAAVLNARDPRVVEMAELCDGAVIFFGIDPALPAIAEHLRQDGRAVFVRDGGIVLAQGTREERLAAVAAIPLTHGGRVAFQVENVLTAVGAAWALGIPVELIRAGIETFDIDQADAPWQFTLFERNGSTVVVDDVHNASALRPLIAAIDQFPSTLRAAVYSGGADRRDQDLIEQGKLLGDAFDRVVLYDDLTVRSKRPAGQARALLRQGLAQGSRVKDVQEEPDHGKAIESQLNGIAAGDFVLLQSDEAFSGPTIDLVRRWIQQY